MVRIVKSAIIGGYLYEPVLIEIANCPLKLFRTSQHLHTSFETTLKVTFDPCGISIF